MDKVKVTLPQIFVQDCVEVVAWNDAEHGCLEIILGPLTVTVFSDDGMPVIKQVTEKPAVM